MSDSVDPIDGSPPGPRPWDSPGKNTGVGCHFLLQCMKVKSESEDVQSCPTLSDPMDCSLPGSSVHGILQARVLEWGAIAFSAPNLWNTVKAVLRGKYIAIQAYLKKQEQSQINNLTLHLKQLEKEKNYSYRRCTSNRTGR